MMKKLMALLLALAMCLSLCAPAWAVETDGNAVSMDAASEEEVAEEPVVTEEADTTLNEIVWESHFSYANIAGYVDECTLWFDYEIKKESVKVSNASYQVKEVASYYNPDTKKNISCIVVKLPNKSSTCQMKGEDASGLVEFVYDICLFPDSYYYDEDVLTVRDKQGFYNSIYTEIGNEVVLTPEIVAPDENSAYIYEWYDESWSNSGNHRLKSSGVEPSFTIDSLKEHRELECVVLKDGKIFGYVAYDLYPYQTAEFGKNTITFSEDEDEKYYTFVAPESRVYEFALSAGKDLNWLIVESDDNFAGDLGTKKAIKLTVKAKKGEEFHITVSDYYDKKEDLTLTIGHVKQPITAGNVTKTYSAKAQSFTIKTGVKENAAVTFTSSNKKVKVDKNGKVTIEKGFIGEATITIKAAATKSYLANSKKITVTVNPSKTTICKAENVKGQKLKVSWKKNTVGSGYEVQYSTDKSFKKGVTTKKVSKNKTTSLTVSKLSKGKAYYARVRTVKKVGSKSYYSGWSSVKSAKIKK